MFVMINFTIWNEYITKSEPPVKFEYLIKPNDAYFWLTLVLLISLRKPGLVVECMMTSLNGNIFRGTGPLCGEFTGWWFETPSRSLWRHCNEMSSNTLLMINWDWNSYASLRPCVPYSIYSGYGFSLGRRQVMTWTVLPYLWMEH